MFSLVARKFLAIAHNCILRYTVYFSLFSADPKMHWNLSSIYSSRHIYVTLLLTSEMLFKVTYWELGEQIKSERTRIQVFNAQKKNIAPSTIYPINPSLWTRIYRHTRYSHTKHTGSGTNEFVFTTTTNSFVCFLGEFEGTKQSFQNYMTFRGIFQVQKSS